MAFGKMCARGVMSATAVLGAGLLASFVAWEAAGAALYAAGSVLAR
jgi:hypothetical protein